MSLDGALAALRGGEWIDLTHAFEPGIPHFDAFPDEERRTVFELTDGYLVHEYRHVGQWGTHMDPPSHFVEGGRSQDEVPVTEMILPLAVVDVRDRVRADADFAAGREAIDADEAAHGPIPPGAFVALHTGWDERWPDHAAMQNLDAEGVRHSPGWSEETIAHLVAERDVRAIGHDTTDTDPGALLSAGRAPAETAILAADRWQIEGLANLGAVPARGALIVATWPKPRDGSGFPARCFAIAPARAS